MSQKTNANFSRQECQIVLTTNFGKISEGRGREEFGDQVRSPHIALCCREISNEDAVSFGSEAKCGLEHLCPTLAICSMLTSSSLPSLLSTTITPS